MMNMCKYGLQKQAKVAWQRHLLKGSLSRHSQRDLQKMFFGAANNVNRSKLFSAASAGQKKVSPEVAGAIHYKTPSKQEALDEFNARLAQQYANTGHLGWRDGDFGKVRTAYRNGGTVANGPAMAIPTPDANIYNKGYKNYRSRHEADGWQSPTTYLKDMYGEAYYGRGVDSPLVHVNEGNVASVFRDTAEHAGRVNNVELQNSLNNELKYYYKHGLDPEMTPTMYERVNGAYHYYPETNTITGSQADLWNRFDDRVMKSMWDRLPDNVRKGRPFDINLAKKTVFGKASDRQIYNAVMQHERGHGTSIKWDPIYTKQLVKNVMRRAHELGYSVNPKILNDPLIVSEMAANLSGNYLKQPLTQLNQVMSTPLLGWKNSSKLKSGWNDAYTAALGHANVYYGVPLRKMPNLSNV